MWVMTKRLAIDRKEEGLLVGRVESSVHDRKKRVSNWAQREKLEHLSTLGERKPRIRKKREKKRGEFGYLFYRTICKDQRPKRAQLCVSGKHSLAQ